MHKKVKERLKSMGTFPNPLAVRKLGATIRAKVVARLPELLEEFENPVLSKYKSYVKVICREIISH
jgi:L-lactate utilization protein LutB